MRVKAIILSLIFTFSFFSCEEVSDLLSENDNARGLKEALKVGTQNATKMLGTQGGYLNDNTVKILLPEQAQTSLKAIETITSNTLVRTALTALGVNITSGLQNTLETAFNTAAETAAPAAVDVFVSTITNMTISDATNILFSSNNKAATDYLHTNSYTGLQTAFSPIITNSMETVKVDIGSNSYNVIEAWDFFAKYNNEIAGFLSNSTVSTAINLAGGDIKETANSIQTVDANLGNYVVGKALDGIFVKVAGEEQKIRTDVSARTNDLLRDVFGQLD